MESMRTNVKDGYLKGGHDREFRPAKTVHEKMKKLPYNYMPLMENKKDPAKFKDDEGNVITENKNFYTNPMKRGNVGKGTTFGGKIPYKEDLYDIQKEIAKKEREYHDSKIQDKPFSQRAKHTEVFNKPRAVYEENPRLPDKREKVFESKRAEHDRAFRPANPAKRGNHQTIEKFPKYVEDPPTDKKYVKPPEDAPDGPPGWKATYKKMTRPTPSVATNFRNLKASYPSAFSRSPVRG